MKWDIFISIVNICLSIGFNCGFIIISFKIALALPINESFD
ncbi:hypothetical protein [uncultured Methanobrevibacter sp.]|nr:hypothetical protein [uncultured Methanobrevibacter sp.]